MVNYTDEQLKESIEKDYGFKKELIKNPKLYGLWHIRFEVNRIKYYGFIAHSGALPQLCIEGYTSEFYDNHGTPITEEYYNEYIKGAKIVLRHYIGEGDWEETGVTLKDQKEAIEYISKLENSNDYFYDFVK